jgi:hypothetical protein
MKFGSFVYTFTTTMPGSRITTVKAAQAALKPISNPQADALRKLIDRPSVGSFDDTTRKRRNGEVVQRARAFGASDMDLPRLGGAKSYPFDKELTIEELRDILIKDLERTAEGKNRMLQYFPPEVEPDASRVAAAALIDNIHDKTFSSDGHIAELASPTLDKMCSDRKETVPNTLFELPTSCSVFPSGHFIHLQHQNESFTFSACMTGSIAWVVWPCTAGNLTILERAYENFAKDKEFDPIKRDVPSDLDGGIVCVQQRREVLRIPPFCPIMGLVLETAVIARYSMITCDSFLQLCRNIPLYKAFWKTEIYPEEKQRLFNRGLVDCFSTILAGEFDDNIDFRKMKYPISEPGPISSLLQSWDEIKGAVVELLSDSEKAILKDAWKNFLESAQTLKCLICGEPCRREKTRNLGRHFDEEHWFSATDSTVGPEKNTIEVKTHPLRKAQTKPKKSQHSQEQIVGTTLGQSERRPMHERQPRSEKKFKHEHNADSKDKVAHAEQMEVEMQVDTQN